MAFQQPLRRIRALIGEDRGLAVLLPEAERLREMNLRLGRALPPTVADACHVVAVANGEARVFCANGAAASRLRSLATTAAKALSSSGCPVDRLRVRVEAGWSRPDRPEKKALGRSALSAWDALDRELPESGLKAAVERLLSHQRKP
ncbi:MAG: hypothetical protein COS39_11050 [Hydrogenophilales bacterium CG03_land_8_20_14_0_80_62_28]|nr:DUF721 domain-containing protein [Betaproteobacteria bacterium]OIO78974.1 MAG: hypothetical protein AUJ86_03370 [Hydrogenophilaceae bacterium CG1_02_62_390]PIV21468.1 MAG: hypothetical protein COS39_11050 [Hydrogenophilales bacterium CG03_land_8_20_14_0_80_62_28]PIW39199.1 MAG: hypothetical protein COW23_02680 [Hydrogenophilales bacterium CG15_BIG_FIL_POST_REV_8_21_14_020_62_31]PIW71038.1 MAG: hypothetical protein COW07_10440 [Hydrogenophilales bacterium CG12_big_fil_rev_8_21_14_0_65_61_21]